MPSIAELIGEFQTKNVLLRGKEITLRAVPISLVSLMQQAFPKPMPPVEPDPTSGTGSGRFVQNTADPAYIQKRSEWAEKLVLIELALAMDLNPDSSLPSGQAIKDATVMKQWGDAAYNALAGVLTPIERNTLGNMLDSMSLSSAEEAAKKA